jgi:hypothetical protein
MKDVIREGREEKLVFANFASFADKKRFFR